MARVGGGARRQLVEHGVWLAQHLARARVIDPNPATTGTAVKLSTTRGTAHEPLPTMRAAQLGHFVGASDLHYLVHNRHWDRSRRAERLGTAEGAHHRVAVVECDRRPTLAAVSHRAIIAQSDADRTVPLR